MAVYDFTTDFLERDEGTILTLTATRARIVGTHNDDRKHHVRLSKEYAAGYFAEDFEFKMEYEFELGTGDEKNTEALLCWLGYAPATEGDRWRGDSGIGLRAWRDSTPNYWLSLEHLVDGVVTRDTNASTLAVSTRYYLQFTRDDDAGSNGLGLLTLVIRTVSHAGSIVDTLTVDCTRRMDPHWLTAISNNDLEQDIGIRGASNSSLYSLDLVSNAATGGDGGGHLSVWHDYLDFTVQADVPGDLGQQFEDYIRFDAQERDEQFIFYKDMGAGYYTSDFDFRVIVVSYGTSTWTQPAMWGVSNSLEDVQNWTDNNMEGIWLVFGPRGTSGQLQAMLLAKSGATVNDSGFSAVMNNLHGYLFVIEKDEANTQATCKIYDGEEKGNLIETLTVALPTNDDNYRYLFAYNAQDIIVGAGTGRYWTGQLHGLLEFYAWPEAATPAAPDDVTFSDVADIFSISVSASDDIKFGEGVLSSSHQSDDITFDDLASLVWDKVALDVVTFADEPRRTYDVAAADSVEFSETIAFIVAKIVSASDDVVFSDVAAEIVEISRSITDDIVFTEVPAFYPLEGCETDFVPSPTIPSDSETILYIYLFGPWATMAYQIRLRRPDFGDIRRGKQRVTVHRTRGGGRRVFKRTPTYRSLVMRFSGMTRKKLLELENFLDNTAGEDIRLIDYNGHTWKGNILTDPTDLTAEGQDQGEILFEFEGELVT